MQVDETPLALIREIAALKRRIHGLSGGPAELCVQPGAAPFSPADATTYFVGNMPGLAWQTVSGNSKIYIHRYGVITRAAITWFALTAGTGESVSVNIRLNNTTDTLVASVAAAAALKEFINTALAINVVPGDYIEIKIVCPTWVTNPTLVNIGGTIFVR